MARVQYTSRNYADIRQDLVNMVKQYYPDIFNDFNDSSVGMMLLELNAAVSDMLSLNTDRNFQETQIDYAQYRKSILSMARTFGLKVPGKRPSITIVDFSVTVPVLGDTFDLSYAPIIRAGTQVTGAGKIFETTGDIDFSSPFTTGGIPNRLIIPNTNANSTVINYTITKREIVVNGFTKVFKKIINVSDVKPFLEVVLPEDNILSIDSIITLDGTDYVTQPTLDQFMDINNRWFEMNALAEDKIFIEDKTVLSDNPGIVPGKYIRTDKRFISEYTDLGFLKITFGGGTRNIDSVCDFNDASQLIAVIGDFINNMSLGLTPTANTTMYIKYRVGGGADSNLGQGILNGLGLVNMLVSGPDTNKNNAVRNSLKVTNPIPVMGGRDEMSVEEIRNLVKYNFSAQERCITIKDYQSRTALMPGKFGVPFRCGVFEEQNKIKIYILGLNANGKLSTLSNTTLMENIAEYLSNYRALNDYIEISNGRIINLAVDVDVYADKQYSKSQVMSQVITTITEYFDINKFQMGENIYIGQLLENINNVPGVINVINIRLYNKVDEGVYSLNEISQPYIDSETREIDISDTYTLFGEPTTMFEILKPETDIRIRIKN